MDSTNKLRELLTDDIDRFSAESSKHKRLYRKVQATLIILTAATTVAAGLGLVIQHHESEIQFIILALSAVATATTAWSESRRARELWQHEREVYYALIDIRRELEFRSVMKALTATEIEELFIRSALVLGSSTKKWTTILDKNNQASHDKQSSTNPITHPQQEDALVQASQEDEAKKRD